MAPHKWKPHIFQFCIYPISYWKVYLLFNVSTHGLGKFTWRSRCRVDMCVSLICQHHWWALTKYVNVEKYDSSFSSAHHVFLMRSKSLCDYSPSSELLKFRMHGPDRHCNVYLANFRQCRSSASSSIFEVVIKILRFMESCKIELLVHRFFNFFSYCSSSFSRSSFPFVEPLYCAESVPHPISVIFVKIIRKSN